MSRGGRTNQSCRSNGHQDYEEFSSFRRDAEPGEAPVQNCSKSQKSIWVLTPGVFSQNLKLFVCSRVCHFSKFLLPISCTCLRRYRFEGMDWNEADRIDICHLTLPRISVAIIDCGINLFWSRQWSGSGFTFLPLLEAANLNFFANIWNVPKDK